MRITGMFKNTFDKILSSNEKREAEEEVVKKKENNTSSNKTVTNNVSSSSSSYAKEITVEERAKYLPAYVKSSAVLGAERAYEEWKKNAPTAPELSYTEDIDRLTDYLQTRKFEYDYRDDPTYIAMRNNAESQGRMAMEDTFGKAASLNGGYATSYGASAASLAYNRYLSEVDNVIPELYAAAYNMYKDEGDNIREQIEMLQALNDDEWSRYDDMLSSYYDEGKMLYEELTDIRESDYNNYLDYYKLLLG